MENNIYNDDCFNIFDKIPIKSINLVLVDLPYGQTDCKWDVCIDLKKMWDNLKRICKDNCQYVFFTTTKFGYKLIESKPKWFRYDLVWEKYFSVGFLNANKQPLRAHEMIYIFSYQNVDDVERTRNLELREYSKILFEYINKPSKQIDKDIGNQGVSHFRGYKGCQFSLPTEKTYNKLIELYNINKMEGFKKFDELKFESDKKTKMIYNPQKTPGKPYQLKGHKIKKESVYGACGTISHENLTGDRHPRSVLKYNQSDEKLHPTQKPSDLCEWLIRTYSNENDLVLDFCMGSGSTIEACKRSNRRYIGIEKDKDIFEIAKKRLEKES